MLVRWDFFAYFVSIRSPKQYKPVSLKKYVGEFCCQGNKGHLRSKIAKIRKWYGDISNAGFRDLYKIWWWGNEKKFDSEVKWLRYGQKRQNRKFRPNAFNFHSIFIEFFEKALYECTEQKNIKKQKFYRWTF